MNKAMAAVVSATLALAATACSGDSGSSSTPGSDEYVDGGTFTAVTSADPGKFDPATATGTATNAALAYAYDTLVAMGPDGSAVPVVAKSWEVKPSSVKFNLRDDVICNDGSKLTATQVAANFSHLADPKNKSPLLGIYVPVGTKATADDTAGTVTLNTPKPYGFLLQGAMSVFLVCGKGLTDRKLLERGMVGTGPYALSENVPGDHRTYTLRKEYAWGGQGVTARTKGLPSKIVIRTVASESTQLNMMVSGQANAMSSSGPDRARLERTPGVKVKKIAQGPGQLFLNQGTGRPAADPAVRKALAQGVNLPELAKIASSGSGAPQTTLTPIEPRACVYDSVTGNLPAFDQNAAKATLDAAGWKPGSDGIREKDGKKLRLRYLYESTEAGATAAGEYLAAQWKQLGAHLEMKGVLDSEVDRTLFSAGDWEVVWLPVTVSLPIELMPFLSRTTAPEGTNFSGIKNAEYVKLAERATATLGKPGCELWKQAEAALFKNVDLLPIVNRSALIGLRKATLQVVGGSIVPTSIRMLKG
ncbi:ABC transporter substrate-binding protein [Actinomadura rubrisoli]|uniref:ABC transporter substrate-binding protein n=1 Tax=Actinomadura rubrisoli TaxID=2530368 RepID=A0A4R5BX81_9ACTN|nr:ABC transporter substrate-binding protein [Actinomadura rubrisoli]TDD90386.1 ABC transporter substrate-binding protein [Actinomadura rubrisoli]